MATIRRWWTVAGKPAYLEAGRLLLCADGGGSNGYRTRLWKVELARLAADAGLEITVCHLPPGTSKWIKIEHRLFSQISMNWRDRPSPATKSSSPDCLHHPHRSDRARRAGRGRVSRLCGFRRGLTMIAPRVGC